MKKVTFHKITIPILFLLMITQALSGLFRDQIGRATFEFVHINGGLALIAVAAAHLAMNFSWVKANYFSK